VFIKNKAFIASSITKRWRVKWPVSFAAISYWPSHFSAVASSRVVRAYRHPIRNVSGTSKAHLPGDYSHANASAPAPDHRRGEADPRRSPRSIFGEPSIAPPSPAAGTVATVPILLLTTLRLKLHRLHLELHCPCNFSNLKSRRPGGLHDRVCDVRELIDRIRRPGNQPNAAECMPAAGLTRLFSKPNPRWPDPRETTKMSQKLRWFSITDFFVLK